MTHPGPRIGVRPILTADAPALYGCAEAQLTAKVPAACAKLAAVSMLACGFESAMLEVVTYVTISVGVCF